MIGSTTGKPRPTNVTDARKLGLLPSVTSITKILEKPALLRWKMEQTVLATLTTPRLLCEQDDAFVERVLNVEKQHEAEAESARNLGTDIHCAIQGMLAAQPVPEELRVYVDAAASELTKLGLMPIAASAMETEVVAVGDGYAGKIDLRVRRDHLWIIDYKTCKTIPKNSYPENRLQLSAYAAASSNGRPELVRSANIYVSTTEPGKATTLIYENISKSYDAFKNLLSVWKWLNRF